MNSAFGNAGVDQKWKGIKALNLLVTVHSIVQGDSDASNKTQLGPFLYHYVSCRRTTTSREALGGDLDRTETRIYEPCDVSQDSATNHKLMGYAWYA